MKTINVTVSRSVLILMTIILMLHTFVSCGGLPASPSTEVEIKEERTYLERPEYTPLETAKPLEYDDSLMLPEYEPDKPATTVRYVASRESDKYHRTSCHYVDQILTKNRVYYTSKNAAKLAGKTPCSVCKP